MHVAARAGTATADSFTPGTDRAAAVVATDGAFALRLQSAIAEQIQSNRPEGNKSHSADAPEKRGHRRAAEADAAEQAESDALDLNAERGAEPADGVFPAVDVAFHAPVEDKFPAPSGGGEASPPLGTKSLPPPSRPELPGVSDGLSSGTPTPPSGDSADVFPTDNVPSPDETAAASPRGRPAVQVSPGERTGIGLRIGAPPAVGTASAATPVDGTTGTAASIRRGKATMTGPASTQTSRVRTSLSRSGRGGDHVPSGAGDNVRARAVHRQSAADGRDPQFLPESVTGRVGGRVTAEEQTSVPSAPPALVGGVGAEEELLPVVSDGTATGLPEGTAPAPEAFSGPPSWPQHAVVGDQPASKLPVADSDILPTLSGVGDPDSQPVPTGTLTIHETSANLDEEADAVQAHPSPSLSRSDEKTKPATPAAEDVTAPGRRAEEQVASAAAGDRVSRGGEAGSSFKSGADGTDSHQKANGDGEHVDGGRSPRPPTGAADGVQGRGVAPAASRFDVAGSDLGLEGEDGGLPESPPTGGSPFATLHPELAQSEVDFAVEKDRDADLSTLAERMQELVENVARERGPGGEERITMRLHPEHLGRLVLHVSVDETGVVHTRFAADSAAVRAMIEQDLPQLRASLEANGLVLGEAGVQADAGSGFGPDQGAFFTGGGGSFDRRGAAPAADSAPSPETEIAEGVQTAAEMAVHGSGTIDIRI